MTGHLAGAAPKHATMARHGQPRRKPLGLTDAEKAALIESALSDPIESAYVLYNWVDFFARPEQLIPDDDFFVWLLLAGRGFGKTRTGAETLRQWADEYPCCRIALIAPTAADARDTMVEGESGLLSVCPPWNMPIYEPSKRRLTWPNGTVATLFSAEEPERLRGPQHHFGWADEMCAWQYMRETWDQFMFGLRLPLPGGGSPKCVVTTTPKPVELVKELLKDPTTFVTRGSTRDNKNNLSSSFYERVVKRYEGTRLGRQEIDAEILDDNPGALWNWSMIDSNRIKVASFGEYKAIIDKCVRVVVGVDPAVTSGEDACETGIVVAGIDATGHGYVFADRSLNDTPNNWGKAVSVVYHELDGDIVVGEVNNGGDLVESVIRNVAGTKPLKYKPVRASRGKLRRAEPIAALYEQNRIHHVGLFSALEDQMVAYDPTDSSQKSPDRMDALVWALTELFGGDAEPEPKLRAL